MPACLHDAPGPGEGRVQLAPIKKINDTTFLHAARTDKNDRIDVELGDSKQAAFFPQAKFMRWDNEVNLSLRLVTDEKDGAVTSNKDKVSFKGKDLEAHFYAVEPDPLTESLEDGGIEIDIRLLSKPKKNEVRFTINSKGLKLEKQGPLTDEYKIGWDEFHQCYIKLVYSTLVIDENNNTIAYRPEHIVGSYAVQCIEAKTNFVGRKLYRASKFGHIPKMKMFDALGKWAWAEPNIEGEELVITIPQDFIDSAEYPIANAAGLVFGYTSVGATTESPTVACSWVYHTTDKPTSSGILKSLSYYIYKSSGSAIVYPALYADGASTAGAWLAGVYEENGQTYNTTAQWITMTLNYNNIVVNTQYWLSAAMTAGWSERYDSSTNNDFQYRTGEPWFPNPWSGTAGGQPNKKYSFYATYIAIDELNLSNNYPDEFFRKNEVIGY